MVNEFTPDVVVSDETELAHLLGSEYAHAVPQIYRVLRTTDRTFLRLESQWHGNEFFGAWTNGLFADVDGVTDGGAFHYNQAVNLNYPIGKLKKAEEREKSAAWGQESVKRFRNDAFNWLNLLNTNGASDPEGLRVGDFLPKAAVDLSVEVEPTTDNLIVDQGGVREGRIDEADIVVSGIVRTQYGRKVVLGGDTYEAFGRDDLNEVVEWDDTHLSFNAIEQEMWSHDLSASEEVFTVLAKNGYTVGVQSGPLAQTISEEIEEEEIETESEQAVDSFNNVDSGSDNSNADDSVPPAFR